MSSRRGKTANTEVKLTRNSIRSNEDQKTSNMADAKYIGKKTVKTRNRTNLDNLTFDERPKPVTRSHTTPKDLYSDGDDNNDDEESKQKPWVSLSKTSSIDDDDDDDDDDEEAKQKPWISPSKPPSFDDGDEADDYDDYDNEDDGELEPRHLILQKRMDFKKAGMGNQKNLFSDDDEDSDTTSKTSSSDHKKTVKSNQTNRKDSFSEGTSWYSNKIITMFSVFVTLVIASFLAAHYDLYGAFRINENNSNALRHFQDHFNALKSSYGNQSEDLWKRTRRSLELHLNKSESNTQPVIILLTAARDAERTLQCLSSQLARVYSVSRNNSYMVISGANKTFQNGESAKLAIDNILASGFQDTSSAAVLQHIESLHPGALLILYKYCDHENAAFKNVALVLTVLLEDSILERQLSLKEIEEKVRDFLSEKMISSKSRESHSEMDADKLSGVWSRISHTVLPVYPEDTFGDCGGIEQGL
ncbi:torsin-1A-interacting protein 1 isoform X2 [Xenopus laevis]|uniref:Torsin-1A-interacting protein 1 isoform X2 n=1 Tax=Xenopus laevis TaxID=8355 RepID=A0A8J0V2R0_XENLA|nr:torsin-1A-interacting protein 1 isoform X2 [Xenopus laevis]